MTIVPSHSGIALIREDYRKLLTDLGLTDEQVQASTDDLSDYIKQPIMDLANFVLLPSEISGTGTFARRELRAGDLIGMMNIEGYRTPLGRAVNHSPFPNAYARQLGKSITLYTLKSVSLGDEITISYRQMLAIQLALSLRAPQP